MPSSNESGKACGKLMRGVYDALTTCARPKGHVGKHDPIWDSRDWPKKSEADHA